MEITSKNWYHCANDFDDFMAKKSAKIFVPNYHRVCLDYTFAKQTDKKVAVISVTFSDREYSQITVSSNSHNQSIYEDFKKFTELNKFHNYLGDYGKDRYISLTSDELCSPKDAEAFINIINNYDPLPTEIHQQLREACGLLPVLHNVSKMGIFSQLDASESDGNTLTPLQTSLLSSFVGFVR